MSKMVQIRNVPDNLHKILKSRAALAGLTLSEFLLREVRMVAARPTVEQIKERLSWRSPLNINVSFADLVREERDNR